MKLTQQHWSSFISEPVCLYVWEDWSVFCDRWTQETLFILLACSMILSTISIFHTEVCCLNAGTERTVHPCRGSIFPFQFLILVDRLSLCSVKRFPFIRLDLVVKILQPTQVLLDAVNDTKFHQMGVGDGSFCPAVCLYHFWHPFNTSGCVSVSRTAWRQYWILCFLYWISQKTDFSDWEVSLLAGSQLLFHQLTLSICCDKGLSSILPTPTIKHTSFSLT